MRTSKKIPDRGCFQLLVCFRISFRIVSDKASSGSETGNEIEMRTSKIPDCGPFVESHNSRWVRFFFLYSGKIFKFSAELLQNSQKPHKITIFVDWTRNEHDNEHETNTTWHGNTRGPYRPGCAGPGAGGTGLEARAAGAANTTSFYNCWPWAGSPGRRGTGRRLGGPGRWTRILEAQRRPCRRGSSSSVESLSLPLS